ncbi:cysteine proteinase [Stereum hirsutum FP-91666 SS1]|uniref:cysteine proteinase n=1 Tax=Stereum hirsutum (strain FP-91666) TaxID=721885 RepID=UPI000440ABE0|nr:cysteine proteinase [Stereum hirsutum FP-91666 SS1]EIM92773.1 cysteine proteinase [Stereum hirsutum FP-91666 SS1]
MPVSFTSPSPAPPKPFSPKADQLYSTRQRRNLDVSKSILQSRAKGLPTSLKPAEEAQVKAILSKQDVVSKCLREQVAAKDVKRLKPGDWLNDEIMNFWGAMILERSEAMKENSTAGATEEEGKILNVHYFSTFFFTKLVHPGYEKSRLAKWTKRFDIFSKDIVLIPVNHANSHWTAAAINFRKKRIESYDSMNMNRSEVFKYLREYLNKESLDKKNKPFDFTGWEDYQALDAPQQFNGFDCGIFTCQFLEYLSRGKEIPFNFTQKDMPYIRKRMIWEIGNAKFMPHDEDP